MKNQIRPRNRRYVKPAFPSALKQFVATGRVLLLISTLIASLSAQALVPRIDSVNPISAHVGAAITISGTNFGATPAANIVYFGAVRAVVNSASATSLTAIVPAGATYAPVTVTVGGLTASANLPFIVTFNSSGGVSFAPSIDFPAEPGETPAVVIADLDGDGKPDLIVANRASHSFSVFRNISTSGSITADSFAPKVDFITPSVPDGPFSIAIGDLDVDGRFDVVVAEPTGGNIFVYRNNSTSGSIAFDAPAVFFGGGCDGYPGSSISIAIRDIDGDGKPDLVVLGCGLNVLRNTSSPGSINGNSFAGLVPLPVGGVCMALADFDGDGKPDFAVGAESSFSIFQNISTVGNIAIGGSGVSVELNGDAPLYMYGPVTRLLIADLNGDGKLDITGDAIEALNYSSPGSFVFTYGGGYGRQVVGADMNGDGMVDILDAGGYGGVSIAIGDLDGDGLPDVAVTHENGGTISVFRNTVAPCSAPILRWVGSVNGQTIGVCFGEALEVQSAQNPANYLVNGGAVTVTSATLNPNGQCVVLGVSGLSAAPNTPFTVTASGIQAICTEGMVGGGTVNGTVPPTFDNGFQTLEFFEFVDPFGAPSGGNPAAGLMQASDGAFYGTTELGGSSGLGTVFKMTPDGNGGYTYRVIHDFSGPGGGNPDTAIVQGSDGALYGTTPERGALKGTVFKLTADGTGGYVYTTLHSFSGPDGAHPSRLLQAIDDSFYGMTYDGGTTGNGTVFKVNSDGSGFMVLHSFNGSDGSGPGAITGLAQGSDGTLYGTTINGGSSGNGGTVFKMNPDGSDYTVLWNFGVTDGDGRNPYGAVVGNDGTLYGVTGRGGSYGQGTVFKLSKDGTGLYANEVLHSFNGIDGQNPVSEILGTDGALYGTTDSGGSSGAGTVFKINLDGSGFILLHMFNGPDGARPASIPVFGTDGALYGTTYGAIYGGASFGSGTVFRLATRPSITILSPAAALAGSSGFTLALNGLRFESGAVVFWNETPLSTTFLNDSQLQAAIATSDLVSAASLTTVTVTVRNPDGSTSNPQLFTITSANIGVVQSVVALPSHGVSVATPNISTPLTQPGEAAVSAIINNAGVPNQIAATAATYTGNPTTGTIIDVGGGYVDLKITGADAGDSATAKFYYPASVIGTTENGLSLQYFNGTIWVPVLSSGGVAPIKNTADNLDGTVSGGRFTVVFDNTSTPKITELSGTVFSITIPDITPPVVNCPANIAVGCSVNALVPVTFSATASDTVDPHPTLTYPIPSGSGFPVGTTAVTCTATDSSGNHSECSFNVTRAPLGFTGFLSPIGGSDATGGSFANPLRTFKLNSTIPVKFAASCGGSLILSGIHRLQVLKYADQTTAGDVIDATPTDGATTGDQFRLADSQWHFNLDTKATGMSAGIWLLRATLSDGSQHSAWIQIK